MYVKVKDIVEKCTEKSEGLIIYQHCQCYITDECLIKIDFEGIVNVTEDFVFGFLGQFSGQEKEVIKRIQYVRVQTYIKTRFKRATKQIMAVH